MVATHNKVEILGKTYEDVIEIKSKYYNETTKYSFFAKNIGLIREDEIVDNERKTILELKEFSLK